MMIMVLSKQNLFIVALACGATAVVLLSLGGGRQSDFSLQPDDMDILARKLDRSFFYSDFFAPDFAESVDPAEARIVDELFEDLHASKFEQVVQKSKSYLQETRHSWNFYFALGTLLIDCKSYRLAQQAFIISDSKLIETVPDAYPVGNYLKRGLNLDPREALTEAYLHELQEIEKDKKASSTERQKLYDKAMQYSHPHGYVYKMYSDFLRQQGKGKQADEVLNRWDFRPAFRNYGSLNIGQS